MNEKCHDAGEASDAVEQGTPVATSQTLYTEHLAEEYRNPSFYHFWNPDTGAAGIVFGSFAIAPFVCLLIWLFT